MQRLPDLARCGNCAHGGRAQLNASRRRVRHVDPQIFCGRRKLPCSPFGTCSEHQPRENAAAAQADDSQLSAL